ncbi:MAG: helix-turn-helix transcriptional regulator [Planctomycetes bacterium]|nr:helix-turn-helix transcriptional regulator [Planctomycetota bacterium]
MGKERTEDPSMRKVRKLFDKSGLTQAELGAKMGYRPTSARQAVSQFLKSGNPQIGMLRRFAKAMGVKLETLI